jgi:hypothetical protein
MIAIRDIIPGQKIRSGRYTYTVISKSRRRGSALAIGYYRHLVLADSSTGKRYHRTLYEDEEFGTVSVCPFSHVE